MAARLSKEQLLRQRFKPWARSGTGSFHGRWVPTVLDTAISMEKRYLDSPGFLPMEFTQWPMHKFDSPEARGVPPHKPFLGETREEAIEHAREIIDWMIERGPRTYKVVVQRVSAVEIEVEAWNHADMQAAAEIATGALPDEVFEFVGVRIREAGVRFMDVDVPFTREG
jgi:hypothetical protein